MPRLTGIELIAAERQRQMDVEGWTARHDDSHVGNQIAMAAACYASPVPLRAKISRPANCGCREACCPHSHMSEEAWIDAWPWDKQWDKRKKHDRIKQLAIAGALIAAEIDRLQRKEGR